MSEFRVSSKGYPRSQCSVTTLYTVYVCVDGIKPPWDGKENWSFVIAAIEYISLNWPGSTALRNSLHYLVCNLPLNSLFCEWACFSTSSFCV